MLHGWRSPRPGPRRPHPFPRDLLVYEDAGHFMYLDQPGRFARDVAAFLAGSASAR